MFPTKSRVLGTETLTFNALPSLISRELSWKLLKIIQGLKKKKTHIFCPNDPIQP